MAFNVRPPSAQRQYDTYSRFDPAFYQLGDNPSEAEVAQYNDKLQRSRETGDWNELLVPGVAPTKFVMRPLPGDVYRALRDLLGVLGSAQLEALCFRAALVGVVGLGDNPVEVKLVNEPAVKGVVIPGVIADIAIANMIDREDKRVVGELGSEVFRRASTIAPRS